MLVLGHLGTSAAMARWADREVDLRWVAFFGLLADLIDKPLGLIILRETVNNGRIYFHSLLVNLLLSFLLIWWRRPLTYLLALWLHQLFDRMWMRPWTALWPFTGPFGYRPLAFEDWVYSILNPYNLTGEAIGLGLLIALAARHRLWQAGRFRAWLRGGKLPPRDESVDQRAPAGAKADTAGRR